MTMLDTNLVSAFLRRDACHGGFAGHADVSPIEHAFP